MTKAVTLREALDLLDEYTCGDNSCYFKQAQGGVGTNGGCQCRSMPFVMGALACVVKAARLLDSTDGRAATDSGNKN